MTQSPETAEIGAPAAPNGPKQADIGNTATAATKTASGAGKPRSRSGCVTCKVKHLKCDETKPECRVCTSKGWTCGGYQREFRWSYKHERKTKGGVRGKKAKAAAVNKQGSQASSISAGSTAHIPGVSEFSLGGMNLDLISEPLISGITNTSPPSFGLINYGWGNDDPSDLPAQPVIPAQPEIITASEDVDIWRRQSSSANLIVPLTLNQTSPPDFVPEEEVEVLPETDADYTLVTTRDPQEYHAHIPPAVTHVPSVLINQWFKSVCGVWSAYDSNMNLNRILATSLWSESESVSACLQSMSASFLATRIPYMRQTSLTMMKTATKVIHNELAIAKNVTYVDSIPTGLLFSLFCIGTTLCWIDAGQLGMPFLKAAKSLLDQINRQQPELRDQDSNVLNFFNKSWVYCDMLLSVVSYDYSPEETLEAPASLGPDPKRADDIPHPWTGISTTASTLFTRAIRLCRSFRHNVRKQAPSAGDVEMVLRQMEEAPKIEEQLLQLEYDSVVPTSETGDQHTPCMHLVQVAEAYRIAALLQLYQTFPDLVALRIPDTSSTSRRGPVPWEDWIVPLSLRLIDILEHIPPESGSRMVQPLLCITASTGLRLDLPASSWSGGSWLDNITAQQEMPIGANHESCDIAEFMDQLGDVGQTAHPPNLPTQLSIDVGNARGFVLQRLNMLENTLPPKPIIMAKSLVQAIWAAYDNEMPGCNSVHWVDVMEAQNLRSFFG
ncbi:fungal-specific transcription factor domain-containing protein [Dactylonectria macrodidyma]|uniref:Fungal-specific transcription factor domain-containing protein n=1 Tax=Dactylonectria macrodidyma TaxID=307937 RepID=A0A9P9F8U4_9HYPO|nr:fungal-specific transcription factor domain-containing protein [Dactylonectria macrodidyma]